jgi:hypothetical protein
MNQMNTDGAFAYRGCDPLDVAGTYIADRENAGPACFQHLRRARQRPLRVGSGEDGIHIKARQNETLSVEGDAGPQLVGAPRGSGHNEDVLDRVS